MNLENIINQSFYTNNFTREEIIEILKDSSIDNLLFSIADKVREKFVGKEIHLRALLEFSNICKQNCKYCGLRAENSKVDRYKLDKDTLFSFAKKAIECGYKTLVLQSGENDSYKIEELEDIIKKLKTLNVAITLSIGEKTFDEYKKLKQAGVDRFLLRIETTDKNLYTKMHPNMSYENRVRCLKDLKKLGYEVGSGCLVGLPNQTIESLADDILFFKNINADMIGIGPFIPCPNTPLEKSLVGNLILSLKVMAITRIMLPYINIPATTAMETLVPQGRILALQSGANVVMLNVLHSKYISKYKIYPKQIEQNNDVYLSRKTITEKIESIGRSVGQDFGKSKNFSIV